jgi:hypothetical protein
MLRPGGPGQPGEQQPVLGARREAEQLGSWAMGKHGAQAPGFTIDAMNMPHNQPPSCAVPPWVDSPSLGVITASGRITHLRHIRVAAGLPLEHHCAQPHRDLLLNEAFVVL